MLLETADPYVTGTEVRQASGVLIDLLDIDPKLMKLTDIATSLSHQERFTGHAPLRPTVAEHSVCVEYLTGLLLWDEYAYGPFDAALTNSDIIEARRAALMHDATESYVSDLSSPAKRALRALSPAAASTFDELEGIVAGYVYETFDCAPGEWKGVVHQADQLAYEYESSWCGWGHAAPVPWVSLDPYVKRCYGTSDGGYDAFMRRASKLYIRNTVA